MYLSGKQYIAGQWVKGEAGTFKSYNPATGTFIEPLMTYANEKQISQALQNAQQAFTAFSSLSLTQRADFLVACADEVERLGHCLIERAMAETGYSEERILTEKHRIVAQLHLFSTLVKSGDFLDARINTAIPERKPVPRSDIRSINQAIGPVVVFGASNFPLAYSVLGGDTVSAFSAGCPVIVKAHNSHAGTCELIAQAIDRAIDKCGLPSGIFSLLFGEGNDIGQQLVRSSCIKAVGFTGSTRGGKALMACAEQRDDPIPVFAEMGSINPVVLLPDTLQNRADDIANKFVASFTMGTGQFCVSPGLLIAINSPALASFIEHLTKYLSNQPAGVMLNEDIYQRYQASLNEMKQIEQVDMLASGQAPESSTGCYTQAMLYKTCASDFLSITSLTEETFGHAAVLVVCENEVEMMSVLNRLPGQLSGTIQADEEELAMYPELVQLLAQKVGRLVINNFPTGVEVCEAMVHGGPFPASSDVRFTSVGTAAIKRFIRPICLQNYPKSLLPEALKDTNPLKINRLVNGVYTREGIVT